MMLTACPCGLKGATEIRNKKILAFILLLLIILSLSGPAWAGPSDMGGYDHISADDTNSQQNNNTSNQQDDKQEVQDEGGVFEQIVAALLEAIIKVVQFLGSKVAGLQPVDKIVFLTDLGDAEKKIAPWTASEIKFLNLWFMAMAGVALPFYIISIAVSFIKLLTTSGSPAGRGEAIQSIWRWFGALIITVSAPVMVESLTWLTSILLDGIQYAFQLVSTKSGIGRAVEDWGAINFGGVAITTGSVLGTALVKLMFAIFWVWINVVYVIRKIVLSVMFCFTPLMALMWSINKNTTAMAVLLGEMASNAFMPVAHALVLCTILGFMDVKNVNQQGTWFQILIAIFTIMPLAEVIRNTLQSLFTRMAGLNEEQTAKKAIAAAVGLGGIMSVGRVFRSALGAKLDSTNGPLSPTDGNTTAGSRLNPIPGGSGTMPGGTPITGTATVPGGSGGLTGGTINVGTTMGPGGATTSMPEMRVPGGLQNSGGLAGGTLNTGTATIPGGSGTLAGGTTITGTATVPGGNANFAGTAPTLNTPANMPTKTSAARQLYQNFQQTMHDPQRAAQLFGGVASHTIGTAVRTVAGAVPAGSEIGQAAAKVVEGGARATGAAAATALKVRQAKVENNTTYREALKQVTGKQSTLSAAGSAIHQVFSNAVVRNNNPKYNGGGSSLDGARWK
ncbi:hypothetical protein [Desulfotomaculum nigrificans]|uniref:hypothetical protein n=1 Tax=Desulfotomaculum nigrificans TaxID=1565 RepID=UPI0001FAEB28|nr:hypothetical protein [Desulfotomaculum nigrificans]